jgi:hypothetical protein
VCIIQVWLPYGATDDVGNNDDREVASNASFVFHARVTEEDVTQNNRDQLS